ncbi:MAG: ASKHA domain-containing protein [Thermodesulfobacteriota bacterium]
MFKINVKNLDQTVEGVEGESVRDSLARQGIVIDTPCNGLGKCGQCGVWVDEPEKFPETPHENISREKSEQGLRLACQLFPTEDISILIPEHILSTSKSGDRILAGDILKFSEINSAVKVYETADNWWLQYDRKSAPQRVKQWATSFSPKGAAIDLGTTTVVVTLISLKTGEELATVSRLNPQIRFGHDIMTRIHHGSTEKGLGELKEVIRHGLDQLLEQACKDTGSNVLEILDITIGGNTTMLQLVAGINPYPLGRVPFKVDIEGGRSYPVENFGFQVNPAARVYIPPVLHAFIGTDITAGLVVNKSFFDESRAVHYIDVGTNGEQALNLHGRRLFCSTAAGPAFEGMGISCGMRAAIGAVEEVNTDGYDLKIITIGNTPVRGVCGSGLLDLIAALLRLRVIDYSGRLQPPEKLAGISPSVVSRLEIIDDQPAFRLNSDIHLTQRDIRQLQLAKGAVRAAIEIILDEAGSNSSALDEFIIAGGFGASLDPESLEIIGLIPPGIKDKIRFTGNASRSGCARLLTDVDERRFIEKGLQEIEHLSIEQDPDFIDRFVAAMEFPEY